MHSARSARTSSLKSSVGCHFNDSSPAILSLPMAGWLLTAPLAGSKKWLEM